MSDNLRNNPGKQKNADAQAQSAQAQSAPAQREQSAQRDTIADAPPMQTSDPNADLRALIAKQDRIIEQQSRDMQELRSILMATIRAQPQESPDTLWAKNHKREMEIKEELDRLAAYFLESTEKRTQWAANQMNLKGERIWKIRLGWCPEVILRADNEMIAQAYYNKICGIRGVQTNYKDAKQTTYQIVDVTNDPAAQQAIKSSWEYRPAEASPMSAGMPMNTPQLAGV